MRIGVYIHIPFCLRKCHYCDFLSFPADGKAYQAYTDALLNEIAHTPQLMNHKIDTIFIGGGTPSVLPPDSIAEILENIKRAMRQRNRAAQGNGLLVSSGTIQGTHLPVRPSVTPEITLEANPATVTSETLEAYMRMGINRMSFGLQSANDAELATLGRLHHYHDFQQNYIAARKAGFTNISIDIMFSLPGQSLHSWRNTLERVAELEPEHISAYGLIVEDGTAFETITIDDELDRQMYALACETLNRQGYERYEISNFTKPGYHSHHNKKYWTRAEYIGLGLGAHSFMNETRWRNTERFDEYINHNGIPAFIRRDETSLTRGDAMAEFMFLGLRLSRGVSEKEFFETFACELRAVYCDAIKKHVALETLAAKQGRIYLTERGINVSNAVMRDFL